MGDRAMAEIRTMGGSLYVYTHWGGASLPYAAVKAVIAAESRWNDLPYATRIIVDQLTKGGRDIETGFGLLLMPHAEDEYNGDKPSVIIDLRNHQLTIARDGTVNTFSFHRVKERLDEVTRTVLKG